MKNLKQFVKKNYREWKDNIAISFQDTYHNYQKKNRKSFINRNDVHKISNIAADDFLRRLTK